MLVAIYKDNTIVSIGDHVTLFPETSFPANGPDIEFLSLNSAFPVETWKEHNPLTQKLEFVTPYFADGKIYSVIVVDKLPHDFESETMNTANAVREERNKLLSNSDWTQVADSPVNKEAWAMYRQALRDISNQEGFPFNVAYPIEPTK